MIIPSDDYLPLDTHTLRLPDEEYFKEVFPKEQIYLHHTVGGSARSTFNYWVNDHRQAQGDELLLAGDTVITPLGYGTIIGVTTTGYCTVHLPGREDETFSVLKVAKLRRVGTAYIIERDGTIYEVFDPKYWCHHLGLSVKQNTMMNQRSIGIELASEGALTLKDDKLYCFDGAKLIHDKYVELAQEWRGYRFFDAYEDAQLASCFKLVKKLCEQFSIPKRTIPLFESSQFSVDNFAFSGVLGHCNVRPDKSDPHTDFPWSDLASYLSKE